MDVKYQVIFLIIFFNDCTLQADENKSLVNVCLQKVNDLQSMKKKLQVDAMQHHEELFQNLQIYARTVGQVATSVIVLTEKQESRANQSSCTMRLSGNDKANIVQVVVTAFILMVEFARFCHARKMHKRWISVMTYKDFVAEFPHLILVEYQILLMKTLIHLTIQGTLPEQIFATITLTKMSLPVPYAKFANKAAKKMYKKFFDQHGNFVISQLNVAKHPYKKFHKKVAQSWQQIALKVNSFSDIIEPEYQSLVAKYIDTPFNNACIVMIHAGIKHDLPVLHNVYQEFCGNEVIEKLFEFYINKNGVKL